MKSEQLTHEPFPPFPQAVRLLQTIQALARTDDRSMNETLIRHARRVLEHAASAGADATRPRRAATLQYCRIRMAKLAAWLVAARCANLISEEQATEARE